MIKAIIFDCFGVLISDGLELVCQRLESTDPQLRAYVREAVGLANAGLIATSEYRRRVSKRLGMTMAEWNNTVSRQEVRNPQVFQLVRSLRPQYKTALLSNIGKGSLAKRFSDAELTELFDVVVASAEVGMLKPDPAIYNYTADKLGVESRNCIFIDDREAYAGAARDTGMQAIWFKTFSQANAELRAMLHNAEN